MGGKIPEQLRPYFVQRVEEIWWRADGVVPDARFKLVPARLIAAPRGLPRTKPRRPLLVLLLSLLLYHRWTRVRIQIRMLFALNAYLED